jgi:sec-independent protein translocase protein TatA
MLLGFGSHPVELLIVVAVALLLFGNRLPDLMRSLGRSVTEFKKGIKETPTDDNGNSES